MTQPQFAPIVAEAAPRLQWIAVTEDNSGEQPTADQANHAGDPFAGSTAKRATGRDGSPNRCSPSGSCSPRDDQPAEGSRPHPRQRDLGQPHRTAQHRSRTRRQLSDLPPVLPRETQSWSLFSVLGVGATAVLMPKWSQSGFWQRSWTTASPISLMPFTIGCLMDPDRPTDHRLRVGVFGFVSDVFDEMFGLSLYGAFG